VVFLNTFEEFVDILQGAFCPYIMGISRFLNDRGDVKTYIFTYVIDVNTSHTPEEGAYSPSWPNGLTIINIIIIIIIIIIYLRAFSYARTVHVLNYNYPPAYSIDIFH
jgi:hypothetical protein